MKFHPISAFFVLVCSIMLLVGCGSSDSGEDNTTTEENPLETQPALNEGEGGRIYGGTFDISNTEGLQSLHPHILTDAASATVATQIMEGLVRFSPKDLSIVPALAESWEISDDGLTYTFHLKKGVKFHDNSCFEGGKGREVTAKDVLYTYTLLCTAGPSNLMFTSTLKDRLKGANGYYEASKSGAVDAPLEGIEVVDDYTIKLMMEQPNSSFLSILAYPVLSILPEEGVTKYGEHITIGTGAFRVPSGQDLAAENFILVRNENYHGSDSLGNKLPLLDTIAVHIIDSKKSELQAFKNGQLDVVNGLPSESIREIVEEQIANFQNKPPKYILDRSPEMGTNWYQFNMAVKHFKDVRVRQAFNYAIDRDKIIDNILNGEAYGPGMNGFSPPAFKGYDITRINGYSYDPDKARQLMASAGYPNANGFPTIKLELNSGGYKNTSVAFEIQKQLMDNLNVNIDLEVVPFGQKLEDERYARADLFRSAWIADYPSPENFLMLFYGKNVPRSLEEPSYPNTTRFVNSKFDDLFDRAVHSTSQEESYELFAEAEQVLMDEAALIVLWYNENYKLIQSDVRNYYTNAMGYRNLSEVYFKELHTNITQRGQ